MAGAPRGAPMPWTISEVLNVGFAAVRKRPLELIGGFFLINLLAQLPGQLPLVLSLAGVVSETTPVFWVIQVVSLLGSMIVGAYAGVGQLRVALAAARDEEFDFGLFFSGGDRMLPMLGAMMLVYLGGLLGMLLLIIPGIILLLGWGLVGALIADTDVGVMESLRESWEAMQGHKVSLLLFFLVSGLLSIAGLCACYVGLFVVLPAIVVAFAEVYRRVTGRYGA